MKIGIQGESGSTNERAAKHFAEKFKWQDFEICPLRSTENVLTALHEGTVDYGTFAWESSRAGLVAETQKAAQKYSFHRIDEVCLEIDHALLSNGLIDRTKTIRVFSHPQAIKEHRKSLEELFQDVEFKEEADTAYAAVCLKAGQYPENSVVIAPRGCARLYGLNLEIEYLPANKGYWTKILLVSK